jgi:saccharopine dehydrogenase-like NADP-dependent oxidoreductase
MKHIAVFGSGKSSSFAIKYLLDQPDFFIHLVDKSTTRAEELFKNYQNITYHNIDINNHQERSNIIKNASLVISLMPPALHIVIANDCVALEKHLITASYINPEIKALEEQIKEKGLMFMCEMGLDPGIDHMSAMQIIDEIESEGGVIHSFKSHCGGLVAPDCDTNPWHYKISWNPRNVVAAGSAGADFLENGVEEHIPYQDLFKKNNPVSIKGLGDLAYYPNRDSLSYKNIYSLDQVKTLVRTTLRYPDFIKAWHFMIALGLTNEKDSHEIKNLTYINWLQKVTNNVNPKHYLLQLCEDDKIVKELFDNLGVFTNEIVITPQDKITASSADILQFLIESKWAMSSQDRDMIVMLHEFEYTIHNKKYYRRSQLIVEGDDNIYTAMAKTVGLPMAILAEQIINGKIAPIPGVQIPVSDKIYIPMLQKLAGQNINFTEEIIVVS